MVLAGIAATAIMACRAREDATHSNATSLSDSMAMAPAFAVPPSLTNLACSPGVLQSGDVLTVRMTPLHGSTLMAVAPDSTKFLVVFYGEGLPEHARHVSLVPPDSFMRVTELNVDPKQLTAAPWAAGRDTNELLFRKAGLYRFRVGSDLEADGQGYAECVVRYVP